MITPRWLILLTIAVTLMVVALVLFGCIGQRMNPEPRPVPPAQELSR